MISRRITVDTREWAPNVVGDPTNAPPAWPSPRDLVGLAAVHHPDRIAVRDGGTALTYAALAAASGRFAAWLTTMGVQPGDRVLVRAEARTAFVVAAHGVLRAHATLVPVHVQTRPARIRRMVADLAPALLLTTPTEAAEFADAVALDEAIWQSAATTAELTPERDGEPALVFLSSGSTSEPKGIACGERQISSALAGVAAQLRYRPDDVVFCRLSLAFDYGFYQVLLAAAVGACLVLAGDDRVNVLRAVRDNHVTVLPVVPSLATMLRQLARGRVTVDSVRLVTNTGERLPWPEQEGLLRTFPNASLALMYGLTECKRVSIRPPSRSGLPTDSVGPPLPGTQVAVVDPSRRSLPHDEIGEIVAVGPHIADGYLGAPELTERRFGRCAATGRRVLFTGDHGYLTEDGELVVLGRRDDLFKIAGVRVSGTEIEAAATSVSEVNGAVVVPPEGARGPVLWVEGRCSASHVLAGVRELLEPAKVPVDCRVLDVLPRSVNGKVDRATLRAMSAECTEPMP